MCKPWSFWITQGPSLSSTTISFGLAVGIGSIVLQWFYPSSSAGSNWKWMEWKINIVHGLLWASAEIYSLLLLFNIYPEPLVEVVQWLGVYMQLAVYCDHGLGSTWRWNPIPVPGDTIPWKDRSMTRESPRLVASAESQDGSHGWEAVPVAVLLKAVLHALITK